MNVVRRKVKRKNIFLILILIFLMFLMIISFHNVVNWLIEKEDIETQIKEINKIIEVVEIEPETSYEESHDEIIVQEETQSHTITHDPYWDYTKMNLIDVNLTDLKVKNSDTVGWIQVSGTNINYPFVQGNDNEFYLTHGFDKSYNSAGWVFLDYRNSLNEINKNTIIYAHSRLDKTMFGSLKNILTDGWLENQNNFIIKMSTENENTLWQVFSIYHIPTTNDYIRVNFINNNDFLEFATMLKDRSEYNFNTNIEITDQILTLSTCYNKTEKLVLHAKMIKIEAKTSDLN